MTKIYKFVVGVAVLLYGDVLDDAQGIDAAPAIVVWHHQIKRGGSCLPRLFFRLLTINPLSPFFLPLRHPHSSNVLLSQTSYSFLAFFVITDGRGQSLKL